MVLLRLVIQRGAGNDLEIGAGCYGAPSARRKSSICTFFAGA
jgi:hypothetical protein